MSCMCQSVLAHRYTHKKEFPKLVGLGGTGCNPSTWKVEAGRAKSLRLPLATQELRVSLEAKTTKPLVGVLLID